MNTDFGPKSFADAITHNIGDFVIHILLSATLMPVTEVNRVVPH